MSFFAVDYAFFLFFCTLFCTLWELLVFFSHCLLGFARLGGLFCVICLSLPLIAHFFFVRFESACLFFALLAVGSRVWTLFLPCLSKTELTGGLARAGAARRRWKSGLWACGAFWRLRLAVGGLWSFFCRVAAFLMERKRNCAGTVWRCLWGRALFACFFVWCVPAFYFGFGIAGLAWRCFCTRQLNRPCFFFIMVH